MRDGMNALHPVVALAPAAAAVANNTPQVGAIVDRLGYESLTYVIAAGALADADAVFTVLLEHGDAADLSDAAAVPDDMLVGTEALAGFTGADAGKCRKLGYVGSKRYSRLTVTPAGNGAAAPMAAVALLGHAALRPTPNPPV